MPDGLRVDSLTKRYGKRTVVNDLSLRVGRGVVAGLVGPNGCGKTTTLSMIAGIREPDGGRAFISGHDVGRTPVEAKRNLAFVPDEPSGFEQLTVLEYLDLYRSLYQRARAGYDGRARIVLEAFGLLGHHESGLGDLSHGARRKVALSAAFSLDVPVLLIDEPTAGLDPESVVVLRWLLRHASVAGAAVLLATQDLAFAERVCEHLFLIDAGRLLAEGNPARLVALYRVSSVEEVFLTITGIKERIDELEQRLEDLSR
ncbi:MAG: ABC transporter ATP-binding protein [Actinomycetota bacterium]|nr:ABC transporter ATP-binding protein [Actinomycetota bacterium]MDQ5818668.1 ABC transporter ATP-binding protein [Actinomycetota bacterium]MDQ5828829.1 ABC transporter ATP-binding protein [Actinomycetota bacterium]